MKEFYIIKKQTSDPYEMVCFLANNMRGITVLLETRFAQYAGIHVLAVSQHTVDMD